MKHSDTNNLITDFAWECANLIKLKSLVDEARKNYQFVRNREVFKAHGTDFVNRYQFDKLVKTESFQSATGSYFKRWEHLKQQADNCERRIATRFKRLPASFGAPLVIDFDYGDIPDLRELNNELFEAVMGYTAYEVKNAESEHEQYLLKLGSEGVEL